MGPYMSLGVCPTCHWANHFCGISYREKVVKVVDRSIGSVLYQYTLLRPTDHFYYFLSIRKTAKVVSPMTRGALGDGGSI